MKIVYLYTLFKQSNPTGVNKYINVRWFIFFSSQTLTSSENLVVLIRVHKQEQCCIYNKFLHWI